MSIILQSSGGGSVTIAEPTTASNFTQTLPASTGTFITTGTPQSGSVLQTVQTVNTTGVSTTSTSLVTSGISATITPKFSTSKILALVSCGDVYAQMQANYFTLYRNSTNLSSDYMGQLYCNIANVLCNVNFNYLDSPATTSSTTYTIYYRVSSGTGYINLGNAGLTTITLLEIAA